MADTATAKDASILRALEFLRRDRPLRAEEMCRDYLADHPGCADHMRLLGHALMQQNRGVEAEDQFRFALELEPEFPQLHEDLGSALAMQSRFDEAIPAFQKAIKLQPSLPLAQKKLGQALIGAGRGAEADEAFREYLDRDPERAVIAEAMQLQRDEKYAEAIPIYADLLKKNPKNINAMHNLALCYWHGEKRLDDAHAMLRRVTQLASDFAAAWLNLGTLLYEMNKYQESIAAHQKAAQLDPNDVEVWSGLGSSYARAMMPDEAINAFEKSIELGNNRAGMLSAYAWELKTVGRQEDALRAYRKAVKVRPRFGPAYWSMANLKIFKFTDDEVAAMLEQVARDDLTDNEDVHFRFSLGKAMEDRGEFDQAWHYYHTGNQRKRMLVEHEPLGMEKQFAAIRETFSAEFLERHRNSGHDAPDPIFIVGLPRSGSTLVEQILASHSMVEGTAELPTLGRISESMGRYRRDRVRFPAAAEDLRGRDFREYGKQYIEDSRKFRSTDKPLFTDKLPNNFSLLGVVAAILPNARIINARRHPYDCCVGNYKQLYGHGQNFTYDMLDLAHYYQQYETMMRHWHEVMPGKVLDVHYEETVTGLDGQVRRILDHCELPFEEACVRFHETERAVKTASSEQVRQPIYTGALGKWRVYDEHIGLWKDQLSDIVDSLPPVVRNTGN